MRAAALDVPRSALNRKGTMQFDKYLLFFYSANSQFNSHSKPPLYIHSNTLCFFTTVNSLKISPCTVNMFFPLHEDSALSAAFGENYLHYALGRRKSSNFEIKVKIYLHLFGIYVTEVINDIYTKISNLQRTAELRTN